MAAPYKYKYAAQQGRVLLVFTLCIPDMFLCAEDSPDKTLALGPSFLLYLTLVTHYLSVLNVKRVK